MQQTHVQKYVFMFTTIYHVVMFIVYAHKKNKQYDLGVPLILVL